LISVIETVPAKDFNLSATLESGQVFGFQKQGQRYQGVISGHRLEIEAVSSELQIHKNSDELLSDSIADFFDLKKDLRPVYGLLNEIDVVSTQWQSMRGLRLIRQNSWEGLAGFILSSNNNIKRIMKIWMNLVETMSDGVQFPQPATIARFHEMKLRELGLGYRASYLMSAARFLANNPEYLQTIKEAPYSEARDKVMSFPGIGEKVADCVLLYGFQKLEAFPVDVWVYRIMTQLFFKGKKPTREKIAEFARKKWGVWAGYVQQYLFHGVRCGILNIN